MSNEELAALGEREYPYGFITDIEADEAPPGLSEEIIRFISKKKGEPQFMLDFRLKAYRQWQKMTEPVWPKVHYPAIDYQSIVYYSAPKRSRA
jgi:Fe-S cluster assembly protein SufB